MKNRSTILILIFTLPLFVYSQNEFLDFVVNKNNDTIYGTIRNVFSKRSVIYEKNKNPEKDKIKFRIHKLRKFKKIRFNDEIYTYVEPIKEDDIYAQEKNIIIPKDSIVKTLGHFVNIQKKLPDFIITRGNDTIYGQIKDPALGKLHLIDLEENKIKIEKENIKSYRFNNQIYIHKEKRKATIFDKKGAYLKLLLNGYVRLYKYEYNYKEYDLSTNQHVYRTKIFFYIEKDDEVILLGDFLYKKKLAELFSENEVLVSKILNEEYTIDNIYLIVRYYNKNTLYSTISKSN